jgi:hypothetical protein
MSLYFVKHQHSAETCPAKDPDMGSMLLNHLSTGNAARYGITLYGDAVLDGQHTFVLILEAPRVEQVEKFMAPFHQAGSVEVIPASHCEAVVERAGC